MQKVTLFLLYMLVLTIEYFTKVKDFQQNKIPSENNEPLTLPIRNYQVRNFMRDVMKKGDKIIFYHSNTESPAAVGICEVVKEGYPDLTAFDPENLHYDPMSKKDNPVRGLWLM